MHKPKYHGQDLKAARARARAIKGKVIRSRPEGDENITEAQGFWSDDADSMVRTWEAVEADFSA